MEEFVPRLNQVLSEARRRGATIIHAPSDCLAAYADHPARQRALAVPPSDQLPAGIRAWCSRIPAEEQAAYPIDQSDGGGDDESREHAQWEAKLVALGRNPGTPWKSQSPLITIDPERDYLSDRGDEIWSILQQRGIERVILTGVHANMCILGRPFGLRQMVKNSRQVVFLRDLSDSMYNPERWPHVDHFTGHDLVISHIERFVCPTITSDQFLGGKPFRWQADKRPAADVAALPSSPPKGRAAFTSDWSVSTLPASWKSATLGMLDDYDGPAWYRCTVRIPQQQTLSSQPIALHLAATQATSQPWLNGQTLPAGKAASGAAFTIAPQAIVADEVNLLVLRVEHRRGDGGLREPPVLVVGSSRTKLAGRWQFRLGGDPSWSNYPRPAKFGASTDIVFEIDPR